MLGRALSLFVATVILTTVTGAGAHEFKVGDIVIDHPWARATAPRMMAGAVFLTLNNRGDTDDRLVSAASPASEIVELHTHLMDGGIVRMRQVEAIAVPAGGTTVLKPGGLHVMLIGLNGQLMVGKSFPLTLTFERTGSVEVTVVIKPIGHQGAHKH